MKLTRNLFAILALTSFTFAFAEDTGMGAKHQKAPAVESKETAESKEMKGCEQCKSCTKDTKKAPPPKVRETGPVMPEYMS
jgi:hypothetical protein